MSLTFVVSTGRCGSTMLSLMLREHPGVLSLSEFFSTLMRVRRQGGFPTGDLDGAELWRLLAEPDPLAGQMTRQAQASQVTGDGPGYPYGRGRFTPDDLPPVCATVLPMLTADPDTLFDQLAAQVPHWPTRPAADQYRTLFGLLSRLLDRPAVIERTGALFGMIPLAHREFPEARFVHLYRDGPDCALSMSRHPGFRIAAVNAEAAKAAGLPPGANWQQIQAAMPPEFRELLTPPFDIGRLMSYPVPLATFGERWSNMITAGVSALTELPQGTWASVCYEDLLHQTGAELARLADFLGIPSVPGWLATAQRLADPARAGRATTLPAADRTALLEACQPGTAALQAAGHRRPATSAAPA